MYGGQAVIEGVMIRGLKCCALAVRRPDGTIAKHILPLLPWSNGKLRKIPFVRGLVVLSETMIIGMKALSISSAESVGEVFEKKKNIVGTVITLSIAFLFAICLFFLLPVFISEIINRNLSNEFLANVIEGLIRLFFFIGYIWLIGRMKEIQRVFGYHGAEHMTVHAVESGDTLSIEKIRAYPPQHPRCGTSFLLTVVLVSILLFIVIPRDPFWFLIISRIVLIPVIAGISYEFIRFTGLNTESKIVKYIGYPNLWLQNLTTRQPEDSMIQVAIEAMNHAMFMDSQENDASG